MTAPVRRRPLPALALIGALTVLTALVWFRVIHRGDATPTVSPSTCASHTPTPTPRVTALPYPRQIAVLLLNSTQRDGLAKRTAKVLRKRGFKVTATAQDSASYGGGGLITGVAEIRYGTHSLATATLLSYYFPTATLRLTKSTSSIVIVSLGRAFTTVPTNPEVARKMKAAGRRLSTTALTPTPTPSPTVRSC